MSCRWYLSIPPENVRKTGFLILPGGITELNKFLETWSIWKVYQKEINFM